jgi:hypothetical protein
MSTTSTAPTASPVALPVPPVPAYCVVQHDTPGGDGARPVVTFVQPFRLLHSRMEAEQAARQVYEAELLRVLTDVSMSAELTRAAPEALAANSETRTITWNREGRPLWSLRWTVERVTVALTPPEGEV